MNAAQILARRVRGLRGDATVTAFAARVQLSPPTISKIEAGDGCNIATAQQLAASLGIPFASLFTPDGTCQSCGARAS